MVGIITLHDYTVKAFWECTVAAHIAHTVCRGSMNEYAACLVLHNEVNTMFWIATKLLALVLAWRIAARVALCFAGFILSSVGIGQ